MEDIRGKEKEVGWVGFGEGMMKKDLIWCLGLVGRNR